MDANRRIREIPKWPENYPQVISQEMHRLLTKLCFRENSVSETDALFCFGTNRRYDIQAQVVTDFLDKGYTKNVILTGGQADYSDVTDPILTESLQIYSHIDSKKYPDVRFFIEKRSKNTLENVVYAQEEVDLSQFKHITFCSQSFSAGRAYLSLRRFLPKSVIAQSTFNICTTDDPTPTTRDNWHLSKIGLSQVWGEFMRILKYGSRGDIAFDEVEELVEAILVLRKQDENL